MGRKNQRLYVCEILRSMLFVKQEVREHSLCFWANSELRFIDEKCVMIIV